MRSSEVEHPADLVAQPFSAGSPARSAIIRGRMPDHSPPGPPGSDPARGGTGSDPAREGKGSDPTKDPPNPAKGSDPNKVVCERCGAEMYRMHAVWRCSACGFKTDCCGW